MVAFTSIIASRKLWQVPRRDLPCVIFTREMDGFPPVRKYTIDGSEESFSIKFRWISDLWVQDALVLHLYVCDVCDTWSVSLIVVPQYLCDAEHLG